MGVGLLRRIVIGFRGILLVGIVGGLEWGRVGLIVLLLMNELGRLIARMEGRGRMRVGPLIRGLRGFVGESSFEGVGGGSGFVRSWRRDGEALRSLLFENQTGMLSKSRSDAGGAGDSPGAVREYSLSNRIARQS